MPKTSVVAELKDLWKEENEAVKTLLGEKYTPPMYCPSILRLVWYFRAYVTLRKLLLRHEYTI